jgi:DNA ligase-1
MANKFLPTLYKKTASGAIQSWDIGVEDTTIVTVFGQVGGKMQITKDSIKVGKNQGRKNETGVVEQALKEMKSRWDKKKKSGYVGSMADAKAGNVDEEVEGGVVPMLAKVFEDHEKKLKYPVMVQPKLDGMRCLAVIDEDGGVSLWSRTRRRILSCDHIAEKVSYIAQKKGWSNLVLDGEIYVHKGIKSAGEIVDEENRFDLPEETNFEKLMSAARKEYATVDSLALQYHVYDVIAEESFEVRLDSIADIVLLGGKIVHLVEAEIAENKEDILRIHGHYTKDGYEGAMVRSLDRGYESKRSDQLLKLKKFLDEEFEIVGMEEGRGKLAGHCGAFVCKLGKETFKVKMSGSTSKLKWYWNNQKFCIGKMLTVKFQEKTAYGIPRFPVGLHIREDL